MGSLSDLVELAAEVAEQSHADYLAYGEGEAGRGLRSMILSIAEQELGHCDALKEVVRRGNIESLFSSSPAPDRDRFIPALRFDASMPVHGFLDLVVASSEALGELYTLLSSTAADAELGGLFRRLASDAQRTRTMAASRRDLEQLGGA